MPGNSPEIANEFLKKAFSSGLALTHMKLQKLVYLAHGWSLAILDAPLVTERVQAWDYGPVYKDLYQALRKYGSENVSQLIKYGDFERGNGEPDKVASSNLTESELAVVDEVIQIYGGYQAFQLSALTHRVGTPWSNVFLNNGRNSVINDEEIKSYFVDLVQIGGIP